MHLRISGHKTKGVKSLNAEGKTALLFLSPSLAGFLLFYLVPFFWGMYYSMLSSPVNGKFVGISNYLDLLHNEYFLKAALNTLLFTFLSVPLSLVISISLALLLNKNIFGKEKLRTLFVTPLVVPVASVVLVWQVLFDSHGSVNYLMNQVGLQPVDWMNSNWARLVLIIMYLWKTTGYNIVLFLAGLQNIPSQYYEAAEIDGAGTFKKFTSITLVYLTPTAFFVFIMSIINSFKVFRETYLIAGAYPHDSIYMLQHYMNNMFTSLDYQKLTSAAFIMAAFIFVLVFALFRIERKISSTLV
ncbi:MAG: sugar ABC transporter permease [Bacillota bacterium]|nr:sugar ABC transporter permease [Bacillota bacterium]